MDEQVTHLVEKVWAKYAHLPTDQRLLIGIAGIPGSGKTTFAKRITARLNSTRLQAAFVPLDGYHLSRATLSRMSDPTTAHARRGAPFTFDGEGFLQLVRDLRQPLTGNALTLYAPSFDHAVKDPVKDDIPIPPAAKIVVIEGNYLALDETPWNEAAASFDELWFIDVDLDVARRRLIRRHVEAGIVDSAEEAERRVEGNDLVNGRLILEKRVLVQETVASKEDERWIQ